jgi:hypothetical protein
LAAASAASALAIRLPTSLNFSGIFVAHPFTDVSGDLKRHGQRRPQISTLRAADGNLSSKLSSA